MGGAWGYSLPSPHSRDEWRSLRPPASLAPRAETTPRTVVFSSCCTAHEPAARTAAGVQADRATHSPPTVHPMHGRCNAAAQALEVLDEPGLPLLLRAAHASALFQALLACLGKDGLGSAPTWRLLGAALAHPALPASEAVPLSLVPQLAQALCRHSLVDLGAATLLGCLASKFAGSCQPSLQAAAGLAAAVAVARHAGAERASGSSADAALLAALRLVRAAVVLCPEPKKASAVVLAELLQSLCMLGFGPEAAAEGEVGQLSRELLQAALFERELLPSLSDWASAQAEAGGFAAVVAGAGTQPQQPPSEPGQDGAAQSETDGPRRAGAFKALSTQITRLLSGAATPTGAGTGTPDPHAVGRMLAWMLARYAEACAGGAGGHGGQRRVRGGGDDQGTAAGPAATRSQALALAAPFTMFAALLAVCWTVPERGLR